MTKIFFTAIIIILLIVNKFFLKKYSLKLKLLYSVFTILGCILFCSVFFIYSWNNSSGNLPPEPSVKKITLNNLKKEKCIVYINFEYTEKEILNNLNVDIANNKIDTIYLNIGQTESLKTPIFSADTIKFPKSFSLVITDLQGRIVKKYTKEVFFDEVNKAKYKDIDDVETKEADWYLEIK